MSNALAIATVTAVLKDLLDNAVVDESIAKTVNGPVTVSVLPPDLIDAEKFPTQLNLFLYHVTPNASWRNHDLPSRSSNGGRLTNPPLALDLNYLLTAYGGSDFEAEILLGYAMQLFHENPVLPRAWIDAATAVAVSPDHTPVTGGILPVKYQALSASTLSQQVEQIKLTLQPMGTEEISKLWTAFQARYRPSVAYQATVVLIQNDRPTKVGPPVRQRTVTVVPLRTPVIEQVFPAAGGPGDPIGPASTVLITGKSLRGDVTQVGIDGQTPLNPDKTGNTQVRVTLPAALSAGAHTLQVVQSTLLGIPPAPHVGARSAAFPFVLRPAIRPAAGGFAIVKGPVTPVGGGALRAELTITVDPIVQVDQRVMVVLTRLADDAPAAYAEAAALINPQNDVVATVTVPGQGPYLVRVQVDGAESPLQTDAFGKPIAPVVNF